MTMIRFNNNFTTPEQSKRLLELGVPANSADCIFTRFSRDEKWKRRFIEDVVSAQLFCNQDFYLPCWSVGRLIEIYRILANCGCCIQYNDDIIETLIWDIKACELDEEDFSKLEG